MVQIKNYGTVPFKQTAIPVEIIRETKPLKKIVSSQINFYLVHCEKTSVYLFVYIILYFLFLCTGAVMFSILERPEELSSKLQLETQVQSFLSDHPNITYQELETLLRHVLEANDRGISVLRNSTTESNWSFGQSFFFTSTVVTTIGYGHVTPLTQSGKLFCIAFAIIGIPLTLVLLSALVNRLLVPTVWFLAWLNFKLKDIYQPFNIRLMHLIIMVSTLGFFFLLIPAGIFTWMEPEWDYLDSLYYCFISLTTIGLGDYVPGNSIDPTYQSLYKMATSAFLFAGITFLMLTLTVFYDIPQLNLGCLLTPTNNAPSENNQQKENDKLSNSKCGNHNYQQIA